MPWCAEHVVSLWSLGVRMTNDDCSELAGSYFRLGDFFPSCLRRLPYLWSVNVLEEKSPALFDKGLFKASNPEICGGSFAQAFDSIEKLTALPWNPYHHDDIPKALKWLVCGIRICRLTLASNVLMRPAASRSEVDKSLRRDKSSSRLGSRSNRSWKSCNALVKLGMFQNRRILCLCVIVSGVFQNSMWLTLETLCILQISFSVVDRWIVKVPKVTLHVSPLGCQFPSEIFDQCVIPSPSGHSSHSDFLLRKSLVFVSWCRSSCKVWSMREILQMQR